MYTECMKISSPPLTKSIFHNLSSSASCLRLPSLVAGGREAEGRAAGMPAIDVFSKGATSFLHCLKPQIEFQRFAHRILSQRENKNRTPQEDSTRSPDPPRPAPPRVPSRWGHSWVACSKVWSQRHPGFGPGRGCARSRSLAGMGKIPTAAAQGEAKKPSGVICVQQVKNSPSKLAASSSQLIPSNKTKTLNFCLFFHV